MYCNKFQSTIILLEFDFDFQSECSEWSIHVGSLDERLLRSSDRKHNEMETPESFQLAFSFDFLLTFGSLRLPMWKQRNLVKQNLLEN